jgi:hypothetical protein
VTENYANLELEVSGNIYTKRDIIEISKDCLLEKEEKEDSGIASSVGIVEALQEIRGDILKNFGDVKSIETVKNSFASFLEDIERERSEGEAPRIVFALCKTWDYLIFSAKSEYLKLAELCSYEPTADRQKEAFGLLSKYNVNLSLGAEDLYIGVKKETGLWFEEHI